MLKKSSTEDSCQHKKDCAVLIDTQSFLISGGGEGTHFSIVSNGADYILNFLRSPLAYYESYNVREHTPIWSIPLLLGNVPNQNFHPSTSLRIPISRYRAVGLPHIPLGIAVDFTLRFHRSSQIFTCGSRHKATLLNRTPVRKHFTSSFSECSHCFKISSPAAPNDRLCHQPVPIVPRLGRDTPNVVPYYVDALTPSRRQPGQNEQLLSC